MLKIGDKLLTRTAAEIDADGANSLGMNFGSIVEVIDINDYIIETTDGSFTVKPDEEGHSWKNFYTIVN